MFISLDPKTYLSQAIINRLSSYLVLHMQYSLSSSLSSSSSSSSSFAALAGSLSAGVAGGTTDADRDADADAVAFFPPLVPLGADGGVTLPVAAVELDSTAVFLDLAEVLALGLPVIAPPADFDFALEALQATLRTVEVIKTAINTHLCGRFLLLLPTCRSRRFCRNCTTCALTDLLCRPTLGSGRRRHGVPVG